MIDTWKSRLTRGEFLNLGWALSLIALFGQAGFALSRFIQPRRQAGAFGEEIVAGRVQEFQPGTVSHVQKGRFFVSRLEDGGFLAMWHRCTHLGCTVPWKEEEGRFHCPCHSSVFDTRGEVLSGPAPRPLDLFSLKIIDDEVIVDTGNPIERDLYDPSQATRA